MPAAAGNRMRLPEPLLPDAVESVENVDSQEGTDDWFVQGRGRSGAVAVGDGRSGGRMSDVSARSAPIARRAGRRASTRALPLPIRLAQRLGLQHVTTDTLTIRRARRGRAFSYLSPRGKVIRDLRTLRRLKSLAVPPAYEDVLYAENPAAHIQAIGRDAAGRLQYRYHPDWQRVREMRKAVRLARLAKAMPRIRRTLGRHLAGRDPSRAFALSAVIELVAVSAIRPGSEGYARLHKTRGAATLLKSHVAVQGNTVTLRFRSKGGKQVVKDVKAPRLCRALAVLRALPGKRLFQYRGDDGQVRMVSVRDVNAFLREIAGVKISLKDFRTLMASVSVLEALAAQTPAASKRGRRRQVLEAVRMAAEDLTNTPAICARSYVHDTVVAAFEQGTLASFATVLRGSRSAARRESVLASLVASEAALSGRA